MKTVEMNRVERLLYNCSLMNDFNCFCVAKIPANKVQLDDELVRKSLFYMQQRHPFLRAKLKVDSIKNEVSFCVSSEYSEDDMKFSKHKLVDSNGYTEAIEKFVALAFDQGDFLWRMMLMELKETHEYAVVLVMVLYITDGMNICTLSVELVNILNSLLTGQVCEEMNFQSLPIIDDVYQLIENAKLFTVDDLKKDRQIKEVKVNYLLTPYFRNDQDSGFKLNLLSIDRDLSQSLVKQAKSKNIKLTAVLATAIVYALKALYAENGLPIQEDFSFKLSASLRIRLEPNVEFCHMRYLTLPTQVHLLYSTENGDRNLWNDSVYANQVIQNKMSVSDEKPIFHELFNFKAYDDFNSSFTNMVNHNELAERLRSENDCDLHLSNIGVYVDQRKKQVEGPLVITDMHFGDTIASVPCSYCVFMFHVCTWNEKLMIQLSSCRREMASKYSDRLMQLLNSILENEMK